MSNPDDTIKDYEALVDKVLKLCRKHKSPQEMKWSGFARVSIQKNEVVVRWPHHIQGFTTYCFLPVEALYE